MTTVDATGLEQKARDALALLVGRQYLPAPTAVAWDGEAKLLRVSLGSRESVDTWAGRLFKTVDENESGYGFTVRTWMGNGVSLSVRYRRCIALLPGCSDCDRDGRRHGEHVCDDLCRLVADGFVHPDGHAAWHRAARCSECGGDKDGDDGRTVAVLEPCSKGRCTVAYCPDCGLLWWSDGPASCRCEPPTRRVSERAR